MMINTEIEPFVMASLSGDGFAIEYESHGVYKLILNTDSKQHIILIALEDLEGLQAWLKRALE